MLRLYDIIGIDEKKKTVTVEPGVSVGQLTHFLNPRGWTLPVVPELDDLTFGGLMNGYGIESTSHKYGLFNDIVVSAEVILVTEVAERRVYSSSPHSPLTHFTLREMPQLSSAPQRKTLISFAPSLGPTALLDSSSPSKSKSFRAQSTFVLNTNQFTLATISLIDSQNCRLLVILMNLSKLFNMISIDLLS